MRDCDLEIKAKEMFLLRVPSETLLCLVYFLFLIISFSGTFKDLIRFYFFSVNLVSLFVSASMNPMLVYLSYVLSLRIFF